MEIISASKFEYSDILTAVSAIKTAIIDSLYRLAKPVK